MPDLLVRNGTDIVSAEHLYVRYDPNSLNEPIVLFEGNLSAPIVFEFIEYQG